MKRSMSRPSRDDDGLSCVLRYDTKVVDMSLRPPKLYIKLSRT